MGMIRVRAVKDHDVPLVDADGRTVFGAASLHVGKLKDGKIIEDGVLVPDTAYYLRRIERGGLVEVVTAVKPSKKGDSGSGEKA